MPRFCGAYFFLSRKFNHEISATDTHKDIAGYGGASYHH